MIEYLIGDATVPQTANEIKVIVHCCNDVGAWGAGFTGALSRKWDDPEREFRSLKKPTLGQVQIVPVGDQTFVANIIGQSGIVSSTNTSPIDYVAIEKGMAKVASFCKTNNGSVHMPRIGCGLAQGSWEVMEPILVSSLDGLEVKVYDLPGS